MVLTAYHNVEERDTIDVYVEGSGTHRASLLGFDDNTDVAVLSICCGEFTSLDWAPFSIFKGSWIMALSRHDQSSPENVTPAVGKVLAHEDYAGDVEAVIFDAPLYQGDSGSPVFDMDGEVAGVVIR